MEGVGESVLRLLDEHAEWAIFLVLLLEESGIPLPVPGDVVMLLAGVRVSHGRIHLATALGLMLSATLLGCSLLYWLARNGGRPMLYRYAKFLRLELKHLERAELFLQRHGWLAIAAGRVLPGLRIATTLAAGVFGVPYRVYLPAMALGSTVYILTFFLLGYFVGPEVLRLLEGFHFSIRLVAVLFGLGTVVAAFVTIRRRPHLVSAEHALPESRRLTTAIMAGLLATATMSLAIDLALYLLAGLGVGDPAAALLELGQSIGRRAGARPMLVLTAGMALYVVLQVLWAIVYAHVERWLPEPDWLGGLLFAVLPLAFSLLVVLPALGAGVAGTRLASGYMPLLGEVARHAVYGVSLSVSYTLLSRARALPRPRPASTTP